MESSSSPPRRPSRYRDENAGSPGAIAFLIFGAVMALVYMALGLILAFNVAARPLMPPPYQQILGLVVIGYGAFRLYRAIKGLRARPGR